MAQKRTPLERVSLRARMHPVGQHFAALLGRNLSPKRWIFIVGCYNSGTTLLDAILAAHPQVGGLPREGVDLTDCLPRPEQFGWNRMWCECERDIRIHPDESAAQNARRIKRQWSVSYPRNAQNLVEKSIANAVRMPFLQAHFRPAYFIYIVRNGYAVAEGIRHRAKPWNWKNPEFETPYPIELCARQWRRSDEVVQEDRPTIERFLAISYEDLTESPGRTIKTITDYLGLDEYCQNVLQGRWSVQKYDSTIRNMNDRNIQRITMMDARKIQSEAQSVLRKYGYEFPYG